MTAEEVAEEKRKKAELDLLLDDNDHKKKLQNLKTGQRDLRFVRDHDNDFAVDPTHKEYRKVVSSSGTVKKYRK